MGLGHGHPCLLCRYRKDAERAAALGFDGVKFDTQPGGPNWNITAWSVALKATGRPCEPRAPGAAILPGFSSPLHTSCRAARTNHGHTNDPLAPEPPASVPRPRPTAHPTFCAGLFVPTTHCSSRPMVIEDCLDKHPDGTVLPQCNHSKIDVLHHPEVCRRSDQRSARAL